jgi:hypothetical protein
MNGGQKYTQRRIFFAGKADDAEIAWAHFLIVGSFGQNRIIHGAYIPMDFHNPIS